MSKEADTRMFANPATRIWVFNSLVAVMDWHSRYVPAWRLSNTLEAGFCAEALEEALSKGQLEVFNTEEGASSPAWSSPRCCRTAA